MHARLAVAVGLLVVLAALAPPASAEPAARDMLNFRGHSAVASFRSVEGCVGREVYLGASEGTANVYGEPTGKRSSAFVSIERRDRCTGELLFLGGGNAQGVQFEVGPRLTAARLRATIPVEDRASGSTAAIAVDVAWTGTGELERGQDMFRWEDEVGLSVMLHQNGAIRVAEAAGRVSDGATEFVPADGRGRGWIAWSNYGQVTVGRIGRAE